MAIKKSNLTKGMIQKGIAKLIPTQTEIAFLCFVASVQNFEVLNFTFMKQMFTQLERGEAFYEFLPIEQKELVKQYMNTHAIVIPDSFARMEEDDVMVDA